jgi:hypothetical protein
MESVQEVVTNETFVSVMPEPTINRLAPSSLSRFDTIISEHNWDPQAIMGREQLIEKTFWSVGDPANSDLYYSFTWAGNPTNNMNIPYDLLRNTTTRNLIQNFTYYRCDFVITINVTGTKFHSGLLVPYFVPLTSYVSDHNSLPLLMNHTMVEANGVNTAVIRIPYVSPRSYLSTFDMPGNFNLGVLCLRVMAPLMAGVGALTSIPVTITFHAENLEMFVPAPVPTISLPDVSFLTLKRKVLGEAHSATTEEVAKNAEVMKAITIGGTSKQCTHNPAFDSPESVRDILKRTSFVGAGVLLPLSSFSGLTPDLSFDPLYNPLMGWMDAGAIFNNGTSVHPVSYWASMYALAKGSLRYTFVFDSDGGNGEVNPSITYGAIFLPGYVPTTYGAITTATGAPVNFRQDTLILPGHTYVEASGPGQKRAVIQLLQPLLDAHSFMPRGPISFCDDPDFTSDYYQFFSNQTSGGAVVLADAKHNSITMDIPFVSKHNAYQLPRYRFGGLNAGTNSNATQVDTNGPWTDDFGGDVSYASSTTANGGLFSYEYQDATIGPHMSPGIIVFYALSSRNVGATIVLDAAKVKVSVFASIGDDFRFGVLRDLPNAGQMTINPRKNALDVLPVYSQISSVDAMPTIPQFQAFGAQVYTGFPPRNGTVAGVPNGNTITTINKFKKVANATLPMNITGDKFDLSATLPTMGMDKPSNTLGPMSMMPALTSPMPNGTGIVNAVRMALRPDETFEASPELFGTAEDEMDLCYLTRKMTILPKASTTTGGFTWDVSSGIGAQLFSVPLSPINFTDAIGVTGQVDATLLAQISSNFLYWSGSLRYRIKIVATSFHTGRLFLGVTYFSYRDYRPVDLNQPYLLKPAHANRFDQFPPADLEEALTQGGIFIDLSEETRDVVFDVPYKAMYPRLDVGSGCQPNQTSIMGKLTCWVVNDLSAPESVAQNVDIITTVGGGPDFQLYTLSPFAAAYDAPRTLGSLQGVVPVITA